MTERPPAPKSVAGVMALPVLTKEMEKEHLWLKDVSEPDAIYCVTDWTLRETWEPIFGNGQWYRRRIQL